MAFQQGAIVLAKDPFKDAPGSVRPFVIVNTGKHPFNGKQYTMMTLSTQEYDDGVEILDDFLLRGELARRSFALPWSVTSVAATDVYEQVAHLKPVVVESLVTELVSYIAPYPRDEEATPEADTDTTAGRVVQ
jgi:hypothetical protein